MPTNSDRSTIKDAADRVRRGDTSSGYPSNRAEIEDVIIDRAEKLAKNRKGDMVDAIRDVLAADRELREAWEKAA